jgi:Asp/Glu/hydantoin racemase
MGRTVGVLHTSFVFVTVEPVFRDLFAELLPDVKVVDFVDSDVLAAVRRVGRVTAPAVRRMCHLAQAAEAAGVDVIFSACSSLGPALDVARKLVEVPVVKVDDAMAEQAVELAAAIGVLATVPTTLGPTADLVLEKAARAGRPVTVQPRLCEGAFDILMSGRRDEHDAMVLAAARELATEVELIVLAQASMGRLSPSLAEATGIPVLSSPRLGVEQLARVIRELDAAAPAAT